MPIQVGPAPKAAVVSYTPLNLDATLEGMRKKVAEVESAAALGYDAMSKLNIQEGYSTQGLADELNAKYKSKVQQSIDNLLKTGDTREYSKAISGIQTDLNSDKQVQLGREDFLRRPDEERRIAENKGGYFGFLEGEQAPQTPEEKLRFKQIDWKNVDAITPSTLSAHYANFAKAENIYNDYTDKFQSLFSYTGLTELGIDPLSQDIVYRQDKTHPYFNDVADKLKNSTNTKARGIYELLLADYNNGSTDSAAYYRAKGFTADEFIGKVLTESAPFLEDAQEVRSPLPVEKTRGGGEDEETPPPTVKVTAKPLTSEVQNSFNNANLEDEDKDLLLSVASMGTANDGDREQGALVLRYLKSVENGVPLSEQDQKSLSLLSYASSLISVFDKEGYEVTGRDYIKVDGRPITGEELKNLAVNDLTTIFADLDIMTMEKIGPSPDIAKTNNISSINLRAASTTGDYILRLANTMNVYGFEDLEDFADAVKEDKNALFKIAETNKDSLFLTGADFLDPEEIAKVSELLHYKPFQSKLIRSLTQGLLILNNREKGFETPDGKIIAGNKTIFKEGNLLGPTGDHSYHIQNNPLAYRRFLHEDLIRNNDIIYTDVYIAPDKLQKGSIEDAIKTDVDDFSFNPLKFYENFEIRPLNIQKGNGPSGRYDFQDNSIESAYGEPLDIEESTAFLSNWNKSINTSEANRTHNFIYGGAVLPGGQKSETGFLFNKVPTSGNVDEAQGYVIIPKNKAALTSTQLYGEVKATRETLAGKTYLPIVNSDYGYNNQTGINIAEAMEDEVSLYGVNLNYGIYNDLKSLLPAGSKFEVGQNNYYDQKGYGITAHYVGNGEVYMIRNKNGEHASWGTYFDQYGNGPESESKKIAGDDLDDLVISLLYENVIPADKRETAYEIINGTTIYSRPELEEKLGITTDAILNTRIVLGDNISIVKHYTKYGDRGLKK